MKCPRRIDLIRTVDEDLPGKEMDRIQEHAATCPRCAAFLEAHKRGLDEFLAKHPFRSVASGIIGESRRRLRRTRLIVTLLPAAAAAAILLVLSFLFLDHPAPSTRIKGEVSLDFFVKEGNGAVRGRDGGIYQAEDRIQFTYSSGANRYLFLVSLDEQGRVSNFNYRGSSESVRILPGNHQILEGSIILDDSVGPERVFAIFSDEPLLAEQVYPAVKRAYHDLRRRQGSLEDLKRLPLPYPQASILLLKK